MIESNKLAMFASRGTSHHPSSVSSKFLARLRSIRIIQKKKKYHENQKKKSMKNRAERVTTKIERITRKKKITMKNKAEKIFKKSHEKQG